MGISFGRKIIFEKNSIFEFQREGCRVDKRFLSLAHPFFVENFTRKKAGRRRIQRERSRFHLFIEFKEVCVKLFSLCKNKYVYTILSTKK